MVIKNKILEILHYGTMAGSAHNHQPWNFILKGNQIIVSLDEGRKLHSLDPSNHQAYTAVGALVENIVIAARYFSCDTTIEWIDSSSRIVSIQISSSGSPTREEVKLFQAIPYRHTNRKKYNRDHTIPNQVYEQWGAISQQFGVNAEIFHTKDDIKKVASVAGLSESIGYNMSGIVEETYNWLRFSDDEYHSTDDGFWIKSMEMDRISTTISKLIMNWNVLKWLNVVGFNRFLGMESARLAQASSGIVLITAKNYSQREFLKAGRAFQRIALNAELQGISIHPINFLSMLNLMSVKMPHLIPRNNMRAIEGMHKAFHALFDKKIEICPVILFRVGYADASKYRSKRLSVDKVVPTSDEK